MRRFAGVLFVLAIALPVAAANLGSSPMNVDGLTIDLLSVERKGAVVTVKWAVRNDGKGEQRAMFVLDGKKATSYLWAKFPAPPPAVKTINILFSDTDPFESIAITDK